MQSVTYGPRTVQTRSRNAVEEARTDVTGRRRNDVITAEQVAQKIGVSQSTISRSFSNPDSVSPGTREKVLSAARLLGYQPNVIARSLITRRTNIVAIVMANLTDPYYPQILDTLTQAIQARGRQTLLFIPPEDGTIDDTLSSLLQYQVDAIIIASATVTSEMARICAARQTPVLLFNRYVPGVKIGAVSCDNVASGREVATFLHGTGHARPAYVSGEPGATTNLDRRNGFVDRWRDLGVRTCLELSGGAYTFEAGFEAATAIARRKKRPDCIFFASDIMALGGIHALQQSGLRVPDDISVIGFDDVPMASWPSFDLTTVRQPLPEMAAAALDMLALDGGAASRRSLRLIPGALIRRGTTTSRQ
jgi:DNA-binding LacI/PurR family transcriptional regulator